MFTGEATRADEREITILPIVTSFVTQITARDVRPDETITIVSFNSGTCALMMSGLTHEQGGLADRLQQI